MKIVECGNIQEFQLCASVKDMKLEFYATMSTPKGYLYTLLLRWYNSGKNDLL